jgi:hypothetical protein
MNESDAPQIKVIRVRDARESCGGVAVRSGKITADHTCDEYIYPACLLDPALDA